MTIIKDPITGRYPPGARNLLVTIDGLDLTGFCAGASEEEGWVDILIATNCEPPYRPGRLPHWKIANGKPVIERRFGKIVIINRRTL